MNKILAGALAGFAATGPMTAAMILMHRRLPVQQRYPLPPRRITMNFADMIDAKHEMSQTQRTAVTIAAHFGYGSAMGAAYSSFTDRLPGPPIAKGIGWGMIVWAGSYLGALPTFDLHEPATREPAGRNLLMIAAHVIWGATLGWLTEAWADRSRTHRRRRSGASAAAHRSSPARRAGSRHASESSRRRVAIR